MTPISKELKEKLNQEGEALARQWYYYPNSDEFRDIVGAYEAAGAEYGAKWEQAKKALDELLNCMPKGDNLQYFHARDQVITGRKLLASWKEEGKEGRTCEDCGTYFVSNGRCPECNPMG